MFIYWLMYSLAAYGAFYVAKKNDEVRDTFLHAICVIFVFFVGLRHQVGGDWGSYLGHYEDVIYFNRSFFESASTWDPAYVAVEYLSVFLGLGIYGVNFVCSAIVMTGIYYFCKRQPQPFLALTVAVPYMIAIVAMGYTRQSVALGFELLALGALIDGRVRVFILLIVCAALFHKSAVLLLALGVLAAKDKSFLTTAITLAISALLAQRFLQGESENLWQNYVEEQMVSEGGLIRVIMNAVPAVIFLLFAKRLAPDDKERRVWLWIALFSLACVPLVSMASTAVDRVALYFLPIQVLVYSRISVLFRANSLITSAIVGGYAAILYVLLVYGTMISQYWVPYDNLAFFW